MVADGVRYIDRDGGGVEDTFLECGKEVEKGCYCSKAVISV